MGNLAVGATRHPSVRPAKSATSAATIPAVESGLLPWQLASPISREVVLPGPGGQLDLFGGLTAANTSADGVFSLNPTTGALQGIGVLPVGLHDAAGAVIGGADLVFGGGSSTTTASVESFPQGGSGAPQGGPGTVPSATATTVSNLPAPRSDAATATIGKVTYLVGGYDGTSPDATVLATTNGRTFRTVASLREPVRYPAVAALGKQLYVFGGEAISGPRAGQPTTLVQVVDPSTHASAVVGQLPEPLDGAVAVTIGGHVYVVGGESTTPQVVRPGVGTTQFPLTPATSSGASTVATIFAFDPRTKRLLVAGHLQVPVSHAGVAVIGQTAWVVGGESNGSPVSAVQMLRPNPAFGTAGAPGAGSPFFGAKLLVADRGNNRLLLFNDQMQVVWTYPSPTSPPNPSGFFFPDDAFFIRKGTAIISNQEENETIEEIAYPSGKVIWTYGHPQQPGSAPGYLHEPDDAYLLRNGQISVADADNCRVLVINPDGSIAHQIGTTGVCVHNPPVSMGSPNGDTPLPNGNLLISEINGSWVSEYTTSGTLVWTVQLPISYPSDPQRIGPDRYLIADYASPGQFLEFNRQGQILYRYDVTSGPGMLNHPSLVELLPSGVLMANDDYRDRMVAIDPTTGALVWQYGINDVPGTGPGMLNQPDGFDLLEPNGSTPTHLATG